MAFARRRERRGARGILQRVTPSAHPPAGRPHRLLHRIAGSSVAGGVVLIVASLIALAWANSPWSHGYDVVWETHLAIGPTGSLLDLTLHEWINDALMALFFLLVGLEIKREVRIGELRGRRRATLPIAAAAGGAILPALLYLALEIGRAHV